MNWIPSALKCRDELDVCHHTNLQKKPEARKFTTGNLFGLSAGSEFKLGYQSAEDIPKGYFCSFNISIDHKFENDKFKTLELYINKTSTVLKQKVFMKILSKHDGHEIITYWNNEFIAKDTLSKANAMYLN